MADSGLYFKNKDFLYIVLQLAKVLISYVRLEEESDNWFSLIVEVLMVSLLIPSLSSEEGSQRAGAAERLLWLLSGRLHLEPEDWPVRRTGVLLRLWTLR